MASLPNLLLPIHGVEYELSRIFQRGGGKVFQLPEDFDIKDPEVLLEECTYDFTVERQVLSTIPNHNHKSSSEISTSSNDSPKTAKQQHFKKQTKIESPSYPSVPPDPAHFTSKQTSKTKSKQHRNYEDLSDALEYIAVEDSRRNNSGKKSKSQLSSSSTSHKHQSGVDKYDRHDKDVGVPENKSKLLDQLTDLLTDDVKLTENT